MPTLRFLLLPAALLLGCTVSRAQVLINEVSAANWDMIFLGGEYEDWVELYNAGGSTVDLSGWYLSDDDAQPDKWMVPAGITIAGGGHLLMVCSGKNTVITGMPHTSFKLTQTKQEFVVLADPTLNVVSSFQFTQPTQKNHSWGRTTDGAATWSIFLTPTPATANAAPLSYYAPTPSIAPAAGGYGGPVNVSITVPAGCTVRYTLDGEEPTAASALYAGPFNVNTTSCVRAVAFSATPGVPQSFIETSTYFINEVHTIPVWSIAAGADVLMILNNGGNTTIAEGNIEYFDADLNLLDESLGEFNEHGGTSNSNDQRAVDYIVRDEFGYDDEIENQLFRGSDRDNFERIILKAAAGDNYPDYNGAHIRDAFVQSLSQVIGLKLDERTYEPCVVYVNGQYWGVYETREKVDDNDFTEYYYDQPGDRVDLIQEYGSVWADYGTTSGWWDLYLFITGNDMTDPANYAQVKDTLNTLSMIDHMIINEYMANGSWLAFNTMWWRGKDPGGDHKKWGYTCWDMDWICGAPQHEFGFPLSTPQNDPCDHEDLIIGGQPSPTNFASTHFAMFNALMANDEFKSQYLTRYAELINHGLDCQTTVGHLDSLIALIDPEMDRHCQRWGGTYDDWLLKVQVVRDFLTARCAYIVEGIENCYDVVPRDITVIVDPPGSGMVHFNTLDLIDFPFTGTYFDSTNLYFAEEAYPTWDFSHWTTNNHTVLPSALDSAMWFMLLYNDTIIAHFVPEVHYDVVFDVVPHGGGTIQFGSDHFTSFPVTTSVPEAQPFDLAALPELYFDFVAWRIVGGGLNPYLPADTSKQQLSISFFAPDSIIAYFEVHDYGYYVPNAFSPNDDGFNDTWLPLGDRVDLEHYDLRVMDRWGREIFGTTDFSQGWDGRASGKEVPIGVYAYRIDVSDAFTDERWILYGHVTVVR
ncbi:MAG: CotH kinase family protein [Flavobacteriales bacterium]|nr:CotH kinase family protein [Flavobacteriales bacterium]